MKKRILCFGDSNTWGYNGVNKQRFDEDTRWTGRLAAMLGDGYTVIEEGHNGRTTVWDDPVENRMAGLTYLWPCMESQKPIDLILIMLGTNDTKCYFGVQPKSIAESAGRLVDMAQKSPFGRDDRPPRVLLVSPIEIAAPAEPGHIFGPQAIEKSRGLAEAFRETAEAHFCDFFDAAGVTGPGSADGIHLDAEGHERLARAFFDIIPHLMEGEA